MHNELLISEGPSLQRMARLAGGVLQGLEIERRDALRLAGNVYRGRVARLLPGLNAAFVDLAPGLQGLLSLVGAQQTGAAAGQLKPGQSLLVQISRDAVGDKSPQVSTALTLPGPHLVLVADKPSSGLSRRITEAGTRRRLGALLAELAQGLTGAAFVARTAAAGASEALLRDEAGRLVEVWRKLQGAHRDSGGPRLLLPELPFAQRILRDLGDVVPERVLVDTAASAAGLRAWSAVHRPALAPTVAHFTGDRPLFAARGVEAAIAPLLQPHVPLPSGGSLLIEHTAAMTTVDVNSGTDTTSARAPFTANLEAVQALPRQLRLRGVGGMIAIDFISLSDAGQWREVIAALQKSLLDDPAASRVQRVDALGVVLFTRKQAGPPLAAVLGPAGFACDLPGRPHE